ncbi:TLC domain-containing protein 1 isoform X2 [Petaurus breviceps papuanus]|uniref:TLC domain-containing protein 1 isoform X2 n=1 Tax=Petaurus breviceps papuanus TaxID=3040969 RepID=UPI0036D88AAB
MRLGEGVRGEGGGKPERIPGCPLRRSQASHCRRRQLSLPLPDAPSPGAGSHPRPKRAAPRLLELGSRGASGAAPAEAPPRPHAHAPAPRAAAAGHHADLPGRAAAAQPPAPAGPRAGRSPAHLALAQPAGLLRPLHRVWPLGAALCLADPGDAGGAGDRLVPLRLPARLLLHRLFHPRHRRHRGEQAGPGFLGIFGPPCFGHCCLCLGHL